MRRKRRRKRGQKMRVKRKWRRVDVNVDRS